MSSYLDTQYPFTSPDTHPPSPGRSHQSYLAARLADLAPKLTSETAGIDPTARLYLAPSVKQILATTADALEDLAEKGDRLRLLLRRRRRLAPRPVLRADERACSASRTSSTSG